MTKHCAFILGTTCDERCAAYTENQEFKFNCARLDAMYEIAWTLTDLRDPNKSPLAPLLSAIRNDIYEIVRGSDEKL